jgi:hypothetical protein
MSLSLINNGDSGLVARTKINDAITALNNLLAATGSFGTSGTSGVSGVRGASTWTPEMINVTQSLTDSNLFSKESGGDGFNAEVRSVQGYSRGVFVTATPTGSYSTGGGSSSNIFFGLSETPALPGPNNDFVFLLQPDGIVRIVEGGVDIGGAGTWSSGVPLTITYDGENVRYFGSAGTVSRTVARAIGNPLYLDSVFFNEDSSIFINFGPMGEAGVDGTSGTSGTSAP